MELPHWLWIALLLLSFVSFLPQLRLLYVRKDSAGLSLFYVLFNLIVATEFFALSFLLVVNCALDEKSEPALFVHSPQDVVDTINLAQFTLVWVLWLVIFIACLARRSEPDHGRRKTVSVIYLAFLLVSVFPLFVDALIDNSRDAYHDWGLDMHITVHILIFIPIVNLLGIAALIDQVRVVVRRSPGPSGLGALSLVGLVAQGFVFTLLALSWLWRLAFPWDEVEGHVLDWAVLKAWFQMVGFVPVDYAVFALGQFMLLLIAVRRGLHHRDISGASAGETAPLLGGQTSV